MSFKTIDARGKACPTPVILTRQAFEDATFQSLEVLVDNEAACENVARTGRHLGCDIKVEDTGNGEFRILLTGGERVAISPDNKAPAEATDRDSGECEEDRQTIRKGEMTGKEKKRLTRSVCASG
jgi:TusA-related sulfurtransferase